MENSDNSPSQNTPDGLRPDKDISSWFWKIPAILLIAAVLPLPYGYYPFLRLIVFAASAFLAFKEYKGASNSLNSYAIIFGVMAILFNPILPIFLPKVIWIVIDLACAATFVGHLKLRRNGS